MIVVPVLMTSCHVSLKPNIGPVSIQIAMTATASTKVLGRPQKCDADLANLEYQLVMFITVPFRRRNDRFTARPVVGSRAAAEKQKRQNLRGSPTKVLENLRQLASWYHLVITRRNT